MTADVHAELIDQFRDGRWRVMRVTRAGTMPVLTNSGWVDAEYRPGDVLLAGLSDNVVCGPVGPVGAIDLAERILEGDTRASTDPLALIALATAVVGLMQLLPPPLRTEPQQAAAGAV